MDWKPGTELRADQSENPILWWKKLDVELPEITPEFFIELLGKGKGKRVKTWGHTYGPLSPHYLAIRGGTTLHTDPAFSRYSVQLQLFNGGYITHGIDADPSHYPVFEPGVVVLLDTHSPHQVEVDPRTGLSDPNKLTAAIDSVEKPDLDRQVGLLLDRIKAPPRVPKVRITGP